MLYLESLNRSLHALMSRDSRVVLIGEDLLDPYGGAFKVSKGLSTKFPQQIISTPISEQAIVGSAIGMAMRGMKPIVEIMFGDFMTLCVDQVVNHASKYHWMFNGKVNVPLVIRTPMGGGRGYGPTHSQSLEGMFISTPGLTIVAPSIFHDVGQMLTHSVLEEQHPVLFIENKLLYPKELELSNSYGEFKIGRNNMGPLNQQVALSIYPEEAADLTIVTYGRMSEIALNAAREIFMEEEILIDIVVLSQLKPFDVSSLEKHVKKRKVLVLEEGVKTGGWGAEISSLLHESYFSEMEAPVERVGSLDMPIPSSMLMEEQVLPSVSKLKKYIIKSLGG